MIAAPVANTAKGSTDTNPVTTSAIDTTGATLLIVMLAEYGDVAAGSVSDSKNNTWTALTAQVGLSGSPRGRLFYVANPTVGTAHTFSSVNGAGTVYPSIAVAAFPGVKLVLPFDQQNGAAAAGIGSIATGSVPPGEDNELIIAGLSGASDTYTIGSSFIMLDTVNLLGGTHFAVALAYKIQTTATPVNPTFSFTTDATGYSAVIATFKAAAASSGGTSTLQMGLGLGI